MRRLGNARMAKIYEAKLEAADEARLRGIDKYIRDKYIHKSFLADENTDATSEAFITVLCEDNLKRVAWFVAHGHAPFFVGQKSTALHIAASQNLSSAALCEFLLLNGAELGALDENGKTPSDIANELSSSLAQSVLRSWAANSHVKTSLTEDV
jgi:hypothetical protein